MTKSAVIGFSRHWDGREAARQAVQSALDQLGNSRPALALLFVSQDYTAADVLQAAGNLLGNVPVWGFHTTCPLSAEGEQPRTVGVALIAGSGYKASINWWPNFVQDGHGVATQFARVVRTQTGNTQGILLAADGVNGDASLLCESIDQMNLHVAGGLASGDYRSGRTICIGGNHAGSGALSALLLGGRLRLGLGQAHGWKDTGWLWKVTRVRDLWVQGLDDKSPAAALSEVLGYPEKDWFSPPLSEYVRLYPLGIETDGRKSLLLRSPLRVEVDGNLRMNSHIAEGKMAHLMVGDPAGCQTALKTAADEAVRSLGSAAPLLGILLVDEAWRTLLEGRSGPIYEQLQATLPGVPWIGGYTLGQLGWPATGSVSSQLVNQHALIALIGDAEAQS